MECISGINTFYWHQKQLHVFKAEGRALSVCGGDRMRSEQGKLKRLPALCKAPGAGTRFLQAGPGWCRRPRLWPELGIASLTTLCSRWGPWAWRSQNLALEAEWGRGWGPGSRERGLGTAPPRLSLGISQALAAQPASVAAVIGGTAPPGTGAEEATRS